MRLKVNGIDKNIRLDSEARTRVIPQGAGVPRPQPGCNFRIVHM